MEEQIQLVAEEYGLIVNDWEEVGSQILLRTDTGLYYVYTCPSAYRFKRPFVDKVKKHFDENAGFTVMPLLKTSKGARYLMDGEDMFYVHRGIRMREVEDLAYETGVTLAEFHSTTSNFAGEKLFYPYRSLGGWSAMWRRRLQRNSVFREEMEADEVKLNSFDEYLLTTYTYVQQMGETSIRYLRFAGYDKVVELTAPLSKIAYQNFDHGYLLFDEDGTKRLAGQMNWVIDMRTRDVGQWIKSEVRKNGWNEESVVRFLEGYNSVATLLDEEYAVIYALLMYPGRYFRAVEAYATLSVEEREAFDFTPWQTQMEDDLQVMETVLRLFPELMQTHFGAEVPQVHWLGRSIDDNALHLRDTTSNTGGDQLASSSSSSRGVGSGLADSARYPSGKGGKSTGAIGHADGPN